MRLTLEINECDHLTIANLLDKIADSVRKSDTGGPIVHCKEKVGEWDLESDEDVFPTYHENEDDVGDVFPTYHENEDDVGNDNADDVFPIR